MTDFRDPFDAIKDHPFDEALSQRYLVYALSTITARSLPDLRDGLKPVHRRLLWAMRLLRMEPGGANPDVLVEPHAARADREWLDRHVPDVDLVLDCSDNFATRQAANAACVAHRKPLVSGAAIRLDGQLAVFDLRRPDSACYACVYGAGTDGDLACSEAGILGPVVGTVGTLQALLAIHLLTGTPVAPVLRVFDGRTLGWRDVAFKKDPGCPVCGAG